MSKEIQNGPRGPAHPASLVVWRTRVDPGFDKGDIAGARAAYPIVGHALEATGVLAHVADEPALTIHAIGGGRPVFQVVEILHVECAQRQRLVVLRIVAAVAIIF